MDSKSVKILRASAGSGKTYRLAYEYIKRVVANPHSYSSILAVTFTNKATEEMKSRILKTLNALSTASGDEDVEYRDDLMRDLKLESPIIKQRAAEAKTLILHDYSNFAISTIDKFFQRIARSFFKELGLDFSYEVELGSDNYLERAVVNIIERGSSDESLRELISRVVGEELENNRWSIKDRLIKTGRLLLNEDYREPERGAAELISIMDKAAEIIKNLKTDIRSKSGEVVGIIKSAGLHPIDFKYGDKGFACVVERMAAEGVSGACGKRLRAASVSPESEWFGQKSNLRDNIYTLSPTLTPMLEDLVAMIDRHTVLDNSYRAVSVNFSRFLLLDVLSHELDRLWGDNNRLPIHRTTSLIADIVNSTEIPFIYEKLGTRYECYMIDEFQDTSAGQWNGFKPLLSEAISQSASECVMLIGDVKQAIYRWRGGDWNILANSAIDDFRGRADHSEQLSTNWRSLPQIVDFNNRLLQGVIALDGAQLAASFEENDEMYVKYGSMLKKAYDRFEQSAKPFSIGGYVELNITEEAVNATLAKVSDLTLKQGYRQKDIAILVRKKSQGTLIARHLIGAGYNVVSDEALYISSSPTVRFLVSLIRLSVTGDDPIAVAEINLRQGLPLDMPLDDATISLLDDISIMPPVAAVEKIIERFALQDAETSYLQAFYQSLLSFSNSKSADLRLFIEWWEQSGCNTTLSLPKDQDAITVITIHKAKGLQFPAVIIPWADWKLLPQSGSTLWTTTDAPVFGDLGYALVEYSKSLAVSVYAESHVRETTYSHIDNINLLYVALTRAENELYIITPPTAERFDNTVAWLINNAVVNLLPSASKASETQYIFGQRSTPPASSSSETGYKSLVIDRFQSWDPSRRLATTMPHRALTDRGATITSPFANLHLGLIMHQIFAESTSIDQILQSVDAKSAAGIIDPIQAQTLSSMIGKALSSPMVKDWFSPCWVTLNERTILMPNSDNSHRPDRVLIRGREAQIIDYKFGTPHPKHHKQLQQYADLLTQMNYSDVRAYLWYVASGTVEQVTLT